MVGGREIGDRRGEALRSGGSVRVLRSRKGDVRDPLWKRGGS